MLPTVFLPFNVVKAIMNGALTMVIYKPVSNALRRARLVPAPVAESLTVKKSKAGVTILAVVVLATALLLALVLAEKI